MIPKNGQRLQLAEKKFLGGKIKKNKRSCFTFSKSITKVNTPKLDSVFSWKSIHFWMEKIKKKQNKFFKTNNHVCVSQNDFTESRIYIPNFGRNSPISPAFKPKKNELNKMIIFAPPKITVILIVTLN